MACRSIGKSYGYESCRFEKDVDEHFHCSICYNVLKEPRMCTNNEHMFCLACIKEHLEVNSQTCPECHEHLSVHTLRRPRVVNNYLSELKIKCDYASRRCPESVRVADLKTHVENCGFAPVLCSNEECGMEINKQDKIHHETEVCKYRKVKCHDCGQIQEVVGRLEENIMTLDRKVEAARKQVRDLKEKMEDARRETKDEVREVKEEVKDTKEKVETARSQTKNEVEGVKREVKAVKENLSKVNKDVDEVKVMMIQMLEKLNMLELLNKLPSPIEEIIDTPREDILIAAGCGSSTKSSEIFSWEENDWFTISEMNEEHKSASSFIYKNQLFVVGGCKSKTIEALDLNELPLKWVKYLGELPYACDDHQTVSIQQRIIHICGYNYDEGKLSNVISELQLALPCTMKELCQIPEPRQCHRAEIFEDKVLIMGGESDFGFAFDSVLKCDVTTSGIQEMPPLPHALSGMATVRWRDQVVVLGGQDEDGDALNDVFMYDYKTGKITVLPSMWQKRYGCCAIITGNTIVVMGGKGAKRKIRGKPEKSKNLNTVECFSMRDSTWKYLPAMNEARYFAVAEVLPSTKKYV